MRLKHGRAAVAQSVEQRIRNAKVDSSIPSSGTSKSSSWPRSQAGAFCLANTGPAFGGSFLGLAQAVLSSGRLFLGARGRVGAAPVTDRRRRRFSLVAISRRRVKIGRSLLTDGRRRLYRPCAPRKPLSANAHAERGCERRPGQRGLCLVRNSCSSNAKLRPETRSAAATSIRRFRDRASLGGSAPARLPPLRPGDRSVEQHLGHGALPRSPVPRRRYQHKTGISRR